MGGSVGPFDISIEVSGNAKALQAAIDNTMDVGRVVVGSWYGNTDVKLRLGIEDRDLEPRNNIRRVVTIFVEQRIYITVTFGDSESWAWTNQ